MGGKKKGSVTMSGDLMKGKSEIAVVATGSISSQCHRKGFTLRAEAVPNGT